MLLAIQQIAERKIAKAIQEGKLNIEKWRGKPLPKEDNTFVPDDLKMAYKILKNAGYLPPEIEIKKEIKKLEDLISVTEDEHERVKQIKKLNFLQIKISTMLNRPLNIENHQDYHRKIVENISIGRKKVE